MEKFCFPRVETDGVTRHITGVRVGSESTGQFRTTEMAKRLENWFRLEVRTVIRFLWARLRIRNSQTNRGIYHEEATSRQHVTKWCSSFQSGRKDVDNKRQRNLRLHPLLV